MMTNPSQERAWVEIGVYLYGCTTLFSVTVTSPTRSRSQMEGYCATRIIRYLEDVPLTSGPHNTDMVDSASVGTVVSLGRTQARIS